MRLGMIVFTGLLFFGVLSLWVEARWAWSLFQVGIFALAGWRAARARRLPQATIALAPLAAATAWPLVQLTLRATVCRSQTWEAALNWFTFLVVFALAADLLADPPARRWFLRAISVFGMVLAAIATVQDYSSGGRYFWLFPSGYRDDVLGPFVNRNQFAAWVELLLPAALYLAIRERRLRTLHGSAAAILFGAVVASASRAGFALACGEVVVVAAALAASRAAPRKVLAATAIQFLALALIAAAVAGWQGLESRLETRGVEALRVDAVKASLRMVEDRPWLGTGLGTWATVYPRYAGFDSGLYMNQAHNDWAQWAAEGGLPFFFFLLIFAALLSKPALRSIYGLGTAAFLLHALVDYPMQQRPALAAWFFAMAGATFVWRTGRTATEDGLLRGTEHRSLGHAGSDPSGLQTAGAASSPRPLQR